MHDEANSADLKLARKSEEISRLLHSEVAKINVALKDINLREKEREREKLQSKK